MPSSSAPDSRPSPPNPRRRSTAKTASAASLGGIVLLVLGYLIASWLGIPLGELPDGGASGSPPPAAASPARDTSPPAPHAAPAAARYVVENVTVRNLDGQVVFQGDVDLTDTLARIAAGRRLGFRNDGSTFQNRERRLPIRARDYYQEYVHPTPGLPGPGPQRVVTGAEGEAYYTHDHYESFHRLK